MNKNKGVHYGVMGTMVNMKTYPSNKKEPYDSFCRLCCFCHGYSSFIALLFVFVLSGVVSLSFSSTPTYADVYTASLTTSGNITVDVNTNKGAALSTDEVTVNSTCPLGYTLTVAGPTDSNLYKGGDNTASSITASTGTPSSTKPIMGESESGGVTTSYLNTWGYSLDSNTTINSNTFIGLTSSPNTLITKNTASSTSGDTLNIHYGVSVDSSKESGSYILSNNGTITYYLTTNPNCSSFQIVYNGNDDDGNTTMSVTHDNVIENDDINLYASNFIKAGYGFAGWSTEQLDPEDEDAANNLRAAVTAGHVYGPNETITADSTFLSQAKNINNVNTITLYAIWIKPTATIQSWKGCGSLSQGDVIALTDQRDNQVYSVAKLADNNCWMIENLRLDNEYTVGQNQTDPNVTNESLAQGYATSATYGNFVGLADPETDHFGADTTANSIYYSGTQSGTATVNVGTTDYPANRIPRYSNVNTHNTVSDMTSPDQNVYSYGNYYNWPAAIATLEHYDENSQSAATTSICPAGWQLPIGRQTVVNTSFGALSVALGGPSDGASASDDSNPTGLELSKVFRGYPNNFLLAGRFDHTITDGVGSYGYYWSSYVNDASYSSALYLNMTAVLPGTTTSVAKSYGRSIRCLAKPSYSIAFDANSGTGTMDNQGVYVGETTTLNANTFTAPSGMYFAGWNTLANGNGTSYKNLDTFSSSTAANDTITLYAQWTDCPGGKICYDKNATSGVEGTMGQQTVSNTATSIALLASNYSRTGYGFAGWNTEPDYTGTFYGPQEGISFGAGTYSTGGLKLYAIWVESQGSLQDTSKVSTFCGTGAGSLITAPTDGTANLSSVSALTDQRDNQTYAIAKLADGKCWMIENLRLESTNSDNATGALAQGYGTSTTYGNFGGLADAESTGFTSTYSANSLYSNDGSNNTINIGTSNYPAYRMPRYNNTNTSAHASSPTSNGGAMYSYGNYYTWHAAIADLTYNSTDNQSTTGTSLCPAGWHLPIGGGKANVEASEFWKMSRTTIGADPANFANDYFYYTGTPEGTEASNKLRAYPNNFLYSGGFNASSAYNRGSYGLYWSSTAYGSYNSYFLSLSSSNVYPGTDYGNKGLGRSIRCTAGS